ncbi:MAG: hypothetical protein QM784_01360 [Polyangiaceae bacterium]
MPRRVAPDRDHGHQTVMRGILAKRGHQPGLGCIPSAMETGFNLFRDEDRSVPHATVRGETVIAGSRHADLAHRLPGASVNQVSRYIKRPCVHGMIKRIGRRHEYYITNLGRRVVLTGLKSRELFPIPNLAARPSLL